MEEIISREIFFLLWSLYTGCLLAVTYWVINIFRKLVHHYKFFICVEDIIYWIYAAIIMFAVMLVANEGGVRIFAIIAMIAGMVIISAILKKLERGITIIYNRIRKESVTHGAGKREKKQQKASGKRA